MENEQELELEPTETSSEEPGEIKEEKPKLTPDQERGIKQRQFTRLAKELGIELPKPEEKETVAKKDFDYGEKAFLKASGLELSEFSLVKEAMDATGKTIEDVLGNKFFQAQLAETRVEARSKDALPDNSKRTGGAARTGAQWWLDKGELPPKDQPILRREVLNAKIERARKNPDFDHQLASE